MPFLSRPLRTLLLVSVLGAFSILIATCGAPPEPDVVEKPAVIVENDILRLRLAPMPPGFDLKTNKGDQLIIEPADQAAQGLIAFQVMAPDAGQDLTFEVKSHRAFIENQPEGVFSGGQELISQLGTTFYSRGRYLVGENEIEETVVFALHPDGDRMLTITYRYPAGIDSSVRVEELFEVLASVEGIEFPG